MTGLDLRPGPAGQHHLPLSITYTLLFEDFVALNKAALRNGPPRSLFWAAYLTFMTGIFLLAIIGTGLWLDGWKSLELFKRSSFQSNLLRIYPAVILLAVVINLVGRQLNWRWTFKRRSISNKEITLSFSEEGLQSSVSDFEGKASWAAIKRVYPSKAHLILFISKLEGFVIPRRAFQSDEAFDTFVIYAKERVNG
ncbi:YcxB family protein [Microvirga solisilvae]|uniref:YcxB family protein n=1 Tax=Microvirga solisilvae TaxID=2919498 RepID=UPI001FAFD7AF|nr:YcxB family protein [Microvirga solisilvae]